MAASAVMAMAENKKREGTRRATPTGNGDAAIIPLGGQTQLGGRSWNSESKGCLRHQGADG